MQYRGNAQHDAQEFLLWLLDRVHEDLNNAVNYSSVPPLKVGQMPGDQAGRAAVTWLLSVLPLGFSAPRVQMEQKLEWK